MFKIKENRLLRGVGKANLVNKCYDKKKYDSILFARTKSKFNLSEILEETVKVIKAVFNYILQLKHYFN